MRTNYGEPLRSWLKGQRILRIIDFGDLPVFQDATTYPCILIISKSRPEERFLFAQVSTLKFSSLNEYVNDNQYLVNLKSLEDTGWSMTDERTYRLLKKIKSKGIPLNKCVDNKIYRGILTGLNKAFVIDEKTKKRLIKEDLNSAEIIKPFLLGRDIKRFAPPKSKKYLIFTRHGINIDKYPAIKNFLSHFKEELIPRPKDWKGGQWKGRKPGKYIWYEIQDTIAYFKEFEKPKIIYPNICRKPEFTFDSENFYTNQKCFIIPVADKYLLGILNSSLNFFLFRNMLPKLRGNFFEPSYIFFKEFPIHPINFLDPQEKSLHEKIIKLVDKILELNKKKSSFPPSSEREKIEREIKIIDETIDELVYELYGITEEEKEIIEREI
jgi:hypothetical protein